MDINNGISISGNAQVSGSSMAAGPGVRATSVNYGAADLTELRTIVQTLSDLVRSHAPERADGPAAAAATAAVQEANRPTPDNNRLLTLLGHVRRAFGDDGAIASAIASAYAAVHASSDPDHG
ncbi:hypothetical protein [Dactylosporangium sp. NPDC048998]|uniref:hypothetical protein n=1 Tax=Dactylosporangium sp. NPDC048998 TaxID=3363976 RepID=UPI00371F70F1